MNRSFMQCFWLDGFTIIIQSSRSDLLTRVSDLPAAARDKVKSESQMRDYICHALEVPLQSIQVRKEDTLPS